MALIVQKFGGSSVGTIDRIRNVARRIHETAGGGNQVVAVVSAMSGVTDKLIGLARELSASPSERELDVLMATGEQQSIALLCMALTLPAGAAAPLVRDECGVFDADTLADLEEQAESASDGHDVDVYFLVVDDIGDADQRDYAKNYYISNGLGYGDEQSGILFLLAVGSRKYVTITYGEGVTAFTDYRIEQQEDEIVPQLSDEEWADAAYTYIDMCDDALDYYADHGEPIDVDNDIGLEDLLIAMIFPLGISAFICFILYRRMKTARQKTEADEYMPRPRRSPTPPAVRPSIPTASEARRAARSEA